MSASGMPNYYCINFPWNVGGQGRSRGLAKSLQTAHRAGLEAGNAAVHIIADRLRRLPELSLVLSILPGDFHFEGLDFVAFVGTVIARGIIGNIAKSETALHDLENLPNGPLQQIVHRHQ